MSEAEFELKEYKSLQELFTRRLKAGARPLVESTLVHPADALITNIQNITSPQLVQAKNKTYELNRFLGVMDGYKFFRKGKMATYYLCPTDYHRVHAPIDGEIVRVTYNPGRLWPVNPWSVGHISQLFSTNERVVIWIKNELGMMALVLVGATNVGKISLSFDSSIVSNASFFRGKKQDIRYEKPLPIKKGQELGVFNMGSTVVSIFSSSMRSYLYELRLKKVKMGEWN